MKRISQIISSIFTPLLVPTYAMILASFLSMLVVLPSKVLWTTIAITFVLTCVIPFAGIIGLYKSGVVNDPGLNSRSERSIPYILIILCYLGCGYFLFRAGAPQWLTLFFAGGAIAAFVNTGSHDVPSCGISSGCMRPECVALGDSGACRACDDCTCVSAMPYTYAGVGGCAQRFCLCMVLHNDTSPSMIFP